MSLFDKSTLPSRSDLPDRDDLPEILADYTPILAGVAMIGAGLLLRRTAPDTLRLPEPSTRPLGLRNVRSGRDAARATRDGIARFMPQNLTKTLGRSLMLMGAATIAVRLLDAVADDDGARY